VHHPPSNPQRNNFVGILSRYLGTKQEENPRRAFALLLSQNFRLIFSGEIAYIAASLFVVFFLLFAF